MTAVGQAGLGCDKKTRLKDKGAHSDSSVGQAGGRREGRRKQFPSLCGVCERERKGGQAFRESKSPRQRSRV